MRYKRQYEKKLLSLVFFCGFRYNNRYELQRKACSMRKVPKVPKEGLENCDSCLDELETYFIVHAAVQQLDEQSGESTLDLRVLLKEDIRRSRRYIFKMKLRRALTGVGFCALIAGLGGFLLYIIMQTL